MIKNYSRIAWRNLMKHKGFSFINIFSLSIGLTCCMLISIYIYHECSYDNYHEKGDRLYQLGILINNDGKKELRANVPSAMVEAIAQEYPEIIERARLLNTFEDDKTLIQYQEPNGMINSFYENKGYIVDASFFNMFTYHFIEGDASSALEKPNSVVVNEEIAKKLFGHESALNQIIKIRSTTNGDHDFIISGVFRPSEIPSHIDARFFMSVKGGGMEDYFLKSTTFVNNNMFYGYFLLQDGANPEDLEEKFPSFVEKHMGEDLRNTGRGERKLFLTNIKDVHLHSGIEMNVSAPGSIIYLKILASIAILTLLIACVNFMNLSTSRSSKRSLEVGVRKVLGAEKSSLIKQFLGESLIMAFLACFFAFILSLMLMPLFKEFSGKEIELSLQQYGVLVASFVLFSLFTGLLAGSYPAFYLSSFKPVKVLKGRFANSLSANSLRKGLVVFQFVISVTLIIGSVVISNQMRFLRSKDLGFKKDQQVVIPLRSSLAKQNYEGLKDSFSKTPNVVSVGASLYYPGIFNPMDWLMFKEGNAAQDAKPVYINFVDETFLQTLDIGIIAGRTFSPQFTSDANKNIIINEKGMEEMGFESAEDAIGKWIGFESNNNQIKFIIIGVVNDFHFKDLHNSIEPYAFLVSDNPSYNYIISNVNGSDIGSIIGSLEKVWYSLNPDEPFEYSFLDQDFYQNYQSEIRLSGMIGYFTGIAIIISCLGLFGLASFSFEQRIKEIGIRKVMGASISNLVTILTGDFLKLVVVAIVLAIPIAWYIMNQWLDSFAYKITISWQVFAFTSALAIIIAILTISFQAIKAAMGDPINNLRTE